MIAAGKLNKRVKVFSAQSAQDDRGEVTTTWLPCPDVWAEVKEETSSEAKQAGGIVVSKTYRIRMRTKTGLTMEHKLEYSGSDLQIGAMMEVEPGLTELVCYGVG